MQTMSFAEFQWPQNPATLSVSYTRTLREQHLPYHGSILQDFGKQCVTVSGEGVFYGERRQEHFDALRQFQEAGTVGVLRLPGHSPMMARLGKLESVGRFAPDKLGYRFVFWEEPTQSVPEESPREDAVLITEKSENLWQLAYRYHTTVDVLRQKNPQIQWVCAVPKGCRVVLP